MTTWNSMTDSNGHLSDHSDSGSDLGIVIVNWNSGDFLRECLESIAGCEAVDRISLVVVVDNHSHDDSCRNLPSIPVPFRLIQNDANLGFAAACNQGAEICDARYLLFLNPDSRLHANSLKVPLEYLDDPQNSNVGICGIQLMDDHGKVGRTCSRLPTCTSLLAMATRMHSMLPRVFPPHFMKEWDHGETRDVEQVIGAFFFARRDLYLRLNGFDERFFVYYEEVDYCMRARQLGFRTVFLSTAQADHAGGGCSNQIRGRSLFYSLRSRILYANKHFRSGEALAVAFATFVLEPVIRISTMIAGLRLKNVSPLCYGFSLLWWDRLISLISTATKARSTLDEASGTAQQVPTMTTETQMQTRSAA